MSQKMALSAAASMGVILGWRYWVLRVKPEWLGGADTAKTLKVSSGEKDK